MSIMSKILTVRCRYVAMTVAMPRLLVRSHATLRISVLSLSQQLKAKSYKYLNVLLMRIHPAVGM